MDDKNTCPKGGNHDWINGMRDVEGGSITSWQCSKCGEKSPIDPTQVIQE